MTSLQQRYTLHETLGTGGMGTVYRATDRLTGQIVALKRVMPRHIDDTDELTPADPTELRLVLAREFQTLASLRHPNIIEVLDYGFDSDGSPFYTMTMLDDAENILEAGKDISILARLGLVVQMLRALAYLHQRGILHRDIKPNNVLVTRTGVVSLLDFGLALRIGSGTAAAGSLPYVAPEILGGTPATVASDLYAVGVILYELLLGKHPFVSEEKSLIDSVLDGQVDLEPIADHTTTLNILEGVEAQFSDAPDLFGIDNAYLADVLQRLLARSPYERFDAARDVIAAIGHATNHQIPVETYAIRESMIRQPDFVGRADALYRLENALLRTVDGHGSAWLVAGESGVGKTRLTTELRTRAMVQGILVLGSDVTSGQGAGAVLGSIPHRLRLGFDPTPDEADLLRRVLRTTGQYAPLTVDDGPSIDPRHTEDSFIHAWRILLERQAAPVLIVLENLHLCTPEVLRRLQRMFVAFADLRVMWVGTYRDDEYPAIARRLTAATVVKLPRLSSDEVAAMCASMLGNDNCRADLLDMMERETGGNPFLIVETVRALAEQGGSLDAVAHMALPARVTTQSSTALVERRLQYIPTAHRELFAAAALHGRQLDVPMLRQFAPDINLERWLTDGVNAAILTRSEERWYFAHEQLRDGIIATYLPNDDALAAMHRRVAHAIEAAYGDVGLRAVALTDHYRGSGDLALERHYACLAGEVYFNDNLLNAAIPQLRRAIALMNLPELPPERPLRMAYVHRLLGAAYFRVGNLDEARAVTINALAVLGHPIPLDAEAQSLLVQRLLAERYVRGDETPLPRPAPGNIVVVIEMALCFDQLAEIAMLDYDPLLSSLAVLQGVGLAEELGPTSVLARLYATHARTLQLEGDRDGARKNARRAVRVAEIDGNDSVLSWAWLQRAAVNVMNADWADADTALEAAVERLSRMTDRRRFEEALALRALMHMEYNLDLDTAHECWQQVARSAEARGDDQMVLWGLAGLSEVAMRDRDRLDDGMAYARQAGRVAVESRGYLSIRATALTALAYSVQGDHETAVAHALRAVDGIQRLRSHTVLWRLPGIDLSLQVLLYAVLAGADDAPRIKQAASHAQYALSSMVAMFPIAEPYAHRWLGLRAFIEGDGEQARYQLEKGIERAKSLQMPYQEARTRLEYARLLDAMPRLFVVDEARRIFTYAGATADLDRLHRLYPDDVR